MSQSVFIVSVALIEMDFTARARRKKIHFEFKEIRTLNYNIMQMIFSWSFFLFFLSFVAYKIGSVFAKWRCLIWSLAPWAKVSLSEINVRSFVRSFVEHWILFAVLCVCDHFGSRTSIYPCATSQMEFCVIVVIVNLWVGKHRTKIYIHTKFIMHTWRSNHYTQYRLNEWDWQRKPKKKEKIIIFC